MGRKKKPRDAGAYGEVKVTQTEILRAINTAGDMLEAVTGLLLLQAKRDEWDAVAMEMGDAYSFNQYGERP